MKHLDQVTQACLSSDGTKAVTTSLDRGIRIWDCRTGKLIEGPIRQVGVVYSVAFRNADSEVVTVSSDSGLDKMVARTWKVGEYETCKTVPLQVGNRKETYKRVNVEISPDGKRMGAALRNTAQLWDLESGSVLELESQHDALVTTLLFNKDSSKLATGSDDRYVRLWDSTTGQPLGSPLKHDNAVSALAFSPNGERIVAGSWGGTARIWNTLTGEAIGIPIVQAGAVKFVAFKPDGRRILTGYQGDPPDKQFLRSVSVFQQWDAETGEKNGQTMVHGASAGLIFPSLKAVFNGDGTRIVSVGSDNVLRRWDAETGVPSGDPVRLGSATTLAEFNVDGSVLFTADGTKSPVDTFRLNADGTVTVTTGVARIWDATTGEPVTQPIRSKSMIREVICRFDQGNILIHRQDNSLQILDSQTATALKGNTAPSESVTAVALSPEGDRLAVVRNGQLELMQFGSEMHDQPDLVIVPHPRLWIWPSRKSHGPMFSSDGTEVLTSPGCPDTWDSRTGAIIKRQMKSEGSEGFVTDGVYLPDGKGIVTWQFGGLVNIWRQQPDSLPPAPVTIDVGDHIQKLSVSLDGKLLLILGSKGTASLWNTQSGQQIGDTLRHESGFTTVAFSPDGSRVLTGGLDKTIRLWDSATGKPIAMQIPVNDLVEAVAFHPDGRSVLVCSYSGSTLKATTQIWDIQTGNPVSKPMQQEGVLDNVAYSADGTWILTSGNTPTVCLWNVGDGLPLSKPLSHNAIVSAAVFSPDSTTVVTGDLEHNAQLWDTLTSTRIAGPFRHGGGVYSIDFNKDGSRIVTGSADGTAHVINLPPPAVKEPERIWLSAQVRLGMTMEKNQPRHLSLDEWQQLKSTLSEMGGDCLSRRWEDLSEDEKKELRHPPEWTKSVRKDSSSVPPE